MKDYSEILVPRAAVERRKQRNDKIVLTVGPDPHLHSSPNESSSRFKQYAPVARPPCAGCEDPVAVQQLIRHLQGSVEKSDNCRTSLKGCINELQEECGRLQADLQDSDGRCGLAEQKCQEMAAFLQEQEREAALQSQRLQQAEEMVRELQDQLNRQEEVLREEMSSRRELEGYLRDAEGRLQEAEARLDQVMKAYKVLEGECLEYKELLARLKAEHDMWHEERSVLQGAQEDMSCQVERAKRDALKADDALKQLQVRERQLQDENARLRCQHERELQAMKQVCHDADSKAYDLECDNKVLREQANSVHFQAQQDRKKRDIDRANLERRMSFDRETQVPDVKVRYAWDGTNNLNDDPNSSPDSETEMHECGNDTPPDTRGMNLAERDKIMGEERCMCKLLKKKYISQRAEIKKLQDKLQRVNGGNYDRPTFDLPAFLPSPRYPSSYPQQKKSKLSLKAARFGSALATLFSRNKLEKNGTNYRGTGTRNRDGPDLITPNPVLYCPQALTRKIARR